MPGVVSVVIVTHNAFRLVRRSIETLLRNTGSAHEVIVVDNDSRDGTREWLLRQQDRLRLLQCEHNDGFSPAVNRAAAVAQGDVLVLLNPDVLVPPGWLPRLCAHLRPGVGAVGPLATACGRQQTLLGVAAASQADCVDADRYVAGRFRGRSKEVGLLTGFCLACRHETFDDVGGLDPELVLGADDFDLCLRLRRRGLRLLVAMDVFVLHVGHVSFQAAGAPAERAGAESWDRFRLKWGAEVADMERVFFSLGTEPVWYARAEEPPRAGATPLRPPPP